MSAMLIGHDPGQLDLYTPPICDTAQGALGADSW
jgi:hypothetical protein